MMIDPTFISSVGFPIAMCCYLIFRFEKKIEQNTRATIDLTNYIKIRGKK